MRNCAAITVVLLLLSGCSGDQVSQGWCEEQGGHYVYNRYAEPFCLSPDALIKKESGDE